MPDQLLPARQRPPRRWRNGGGITCDVAVIPSTATDDNFLWRASLAEVSRPCEFSPWPNVERQLRLLSGAMVLHINGKAHHISPASETIIFSGNDKVYAEPAAPYRVFNLMLRRDKASAWLRYSAEPIRSKADTVLLLSPQGAPLQIGGTSRNLGALDALLLDAKSAAQPIQPSSALIIAEIFTATLVTG